MTLLITGGNGQLGRALGRRAEDAVVTDRAVLDIADPASIAAFDFARVRAIVNAAAFTDVDAAERPEYAHELWSVNVTGTAQLAARARALDIPFVQVSTDYVFGGAVGRPFREDDPIDPTGGYARSKAASEIAAALAPRCYVVRTSWLFGAGRNFVATMLAAAGRTPEISVVDDQVGRPTYARDLAAGILGLLAREAPYGTYHCTGAGEAVSWAGFAREIFGAAGVACRVRGISTREYAERAGRPVAPRPRYSVLALDKLAAVGVPAPDWRAGLANYLAEPGANQPADLVARPPR